MEELTKKCTKCGEVKSLSEFSKDKSKRSGCQSACKCCVSIYIKANKDKIKAKDKAYYEANKEKINANVKAYKDANKDKIKAYMNVYIKKNKDKTKTKHKKYYKANRDKIKERQKKIYNYNSDNLSDGYISHRLAIPISSCPPELIELKRAQLKLIRAIKEQ